MCATVAIDTHKPKSTKDRPSGGGLQRVRFRLRLVVVSRVIVTTPKYRPKPPRDTMMLARTKFNAAGKMQSPHWHLDDCLWTSFPPHSLLGLPIFFHCSHLGKITECNKASLCRPSSLYAQPPFPSTSNKAAELET